MAAGNHFGCGVATVGDQGFMHPAGRRTRVQGGILNPPSMQQIDDQVRYIVRSFQVHACLLSKSRDRTSLLLAATSGVCCCWYIVCGSQKKGYFVRLSFLRAGLVLGRESEEYRRVPQCMQ